MIDNTTNMLLYIEPTGPRSVSPTIDNLTKRMTAAYRNSQPGVVVDGELVSVYTAGFHTCSCGAKSDTTEHVLQNMQQQTNSLCIHYLAYHRSEIPQTELDKLLQLPNEEQEPTAEELSVFFTDYAPKTAYEYITCVRQLAAITNKAMDTLDNGQPVTKSSLERIAQNVETVASLRGDSGIYESTRPEGLTEFQKEMYSLEDYLRGRLLKLGYTYPQPRSISDVV